MAKAIWEQGYTQNRELSWLQFNARVLAEAQDESVPLLERLKFLSIFTSNLEGSYQRLLVAPSGFKNRILELMDEQIALGKDGYILLKFNSLTDIDIIRKLSEASCAGVRVEMIVRGICCLRPGVSGRTENISIISIVGRYLEHSRIFCFGRGENEKMYIASADFMTRNTVRRVEIACPIDSAEVRRRLHGILDVMLADSVKARVLQPDGSYCKKPRAYEPVCAQELLMQQAVNAAKEAAEIPTPQKPTLWQSLTDFFKSHGLIPREKSCRHVLRAGSPFSYSFLCSHTRFSMPSAAQTARTTPSSVLGGAMWRAARLRSGCPFSMQ